MHRLVLQVTEPIVERSRTRPTVYLVPLRRAAEPEGFGRELFAPVGSSVSDADRGASVFAHA